jgi:N-acetylmuramoyl-L-alanine amidase
VLVAPPPAPSPSSPPSRAEATPTRARPSGYSVQVGAFGERANAESLASAIEGKGIPAFVIPSRSVFKVWAGDEPDRARAQAIAARLKSELGLDGWVVR